VLASLPSAAPDVISSASGSCNTDSSTDCVCSSNYDSACGASSGEYQNNEACTIEFTGTVSLTVTTFSTESGFDRLSASDGTQYDGSSGPSNVETTSLQWSSDGSVTSSGFKVCATAAVTGPNPPPSPSQPPPLPSPSPPPPLPYFSFLSGSGCTSSDDGQCVASSNWPSDYDAGTACTFYPPASDSVYVAAFDLGIAATLTMGSLSYSSTNPLSVGDSLFLSSSMISWVATESGSEVAAGFKLCTQTFVDNGGDTSGGGGGDSFDPTALVVILTLCVVAGLGCAWFKHKAARSSSNGPLAAGQPPPLAPRGFPSTTASGPAAGTAKFAGAVANDAKLDLRWEENQAKRERQRARDVAEAEAKSRAYKERLEREERERKAEMEQFVAGYKQEVAVVVQRVTDQYEERARPPAQHGRAAALRRELDGCLTNNKKLRACAAFAASHNARGHVQLSLGDLKEVLGTLDYPEYRQHEVCEALLPCLDHHATSYAKSIINPVNTI